MEGLAEGLHSLLVGVLAGLNIRDSLYFCMLCLIKNSLLEHG
jgi:hypothetical protein